MSANQRAVLLAKRPKPQRLDVNHMLLIVVAFKLGQDWSPEQISQWLRRAYPDNASMRLSHESIYRSIDIADRKALARCLARPSHHRGRLKNMVSIHRRPTGIEIRAEVRHWEGDLVMGARPSPSATRCHRFPA